MKYKGIKNIVEGHMFFLERTIKQLSNKINLVPRIPPEQLKQKLYRYGERFFSAGGVGKSNEIIVIGVQEEKTYYITFYKRYDGLYGMKIVIV